MIWHATHTTLLETWHFIQLNIPTRTALFSCLSGLLIIVTAQEKTFSSLPRVNNDQLICPSHWKSGRNKVYSNSCSNISHGPTHAGKEEHSQCCVAWSRNGPADPSHCFPGPGPCPWGALLKIQLCHSTSSTQIIMGIQLIVVTSIMYSLSNMNALSISMPVTACLVVIVIQHRHNKGNKEHVSQGFGPDMTWT